MELSAGNSRGSLDYYPASTNYGDLCDSLADINHHLSINGCDIDSSADGRGKRCGYQDYIGAGCASDEPGKHLPVLDGSTGWAADQGPRRHKGGPPQSLNGSSDQ